MTPYVSFLLKFLRDNKKPSLNGQNISTLYIYKKKKSLLINTNDLGDAKSDSGTFSLQTHSGQISD